MFITSRDNTFSYYDSSMYATRDKFYGPNSAPWPRKQGEVGEFICTTNSLEDLEISHPELFI